MVSNTDYNNKTEGSIRQQLGNIWLSLGIVYLLRTQNVLKN